MLTLDALKSRVSDHFSSFESVGDNVGRFIRSSEGRPFAVYYVDVSERIPGSMEELDAYQDRVIAPSYFQGPKSLQWSHYLFFVASTSVPGETRELVERDRKYARKFIVSEPELTSALTPPKFQIAEGVIDASVLSTWTELLAEANLDHAVFNNDSLPQRIKRIEAEFGHKGLGNPSPVLIRHKESPPFISSLELLKFRPCPRQRSFEFGTVTLVTGANGSGKTSLLEAIELLYCGVNKRDQKSRAPYNIRATFRDGQTETASIGNPTPSELRDRNLAWYGQADIRTNTLFQSFSRYNFLDTDAAVAIADSKKDFEEDLSKLLVGPEASKTWREIERTNGELEKTLKELSAVEQQVQRELVAVEKQLSAAAAVPKESDALVKTLSEKLSDAALLIPSDELVGRIPSLISMFATLEPIIEQATSCDWAGSPVTIQTLRHFEATTEQFLVDGEAAILECQSSAKLRHAGDLLGVEKPTLNECQTVISKRRERRDLVRSLMKQFDSSDAKTMIEDDQPLAELLTSIKLIRNLLTNIQTALTNEQQAIVMASESTKRKSEISTQLEGLQPRIKRLRETEEVFRSILERHSLASAMQDALLQNKAVIEEIFRRIHSPAEFSGLLDMTTLRRKDGQEAKLHQISTGQRAAYALSLFLAQNARLRSAPQLMLIDDPIAHVDDLNSLSFLDYLREVALTGDRQIVFATANEKLASLFERKFDFLGPSEFKVHSLRR